MRKLLTLWALAALVSCSTGKPLSERVVRSEMARNPEASFIDGQQGNLKWNYTTGLELKAFLDVYQHYGSRDKAVLEYVDSWYDAIIDSAGVIHNYKKSNFSTDHICPGRTLFTLYDITGRQKYRAAIDSLFSQIKDQPRTPEGGFWHKKIYPQQMWLDGLYMAQPFYAEYASRYLEGEQQAACFADVVSHFIIVEAGTFDEETGLLRHAWDASRQSFWADPETGQSAHSWGRALGWYTMALVDVLEILPEGTPDREEMVGTLRHIFSVLPDYADPETGLWYQVLDRPGAEGNYLEATCCAMFSYSLLKGLRLGLLDPSLKDYALGVYDSFLREFVREDGQGNIELIRCCEVAGLGGKENRSGDYDYYIGEKIRSNDPKGIGPLIWAALEKESI